MFPPRAHVFLMYCITTRKSIRYKKFHIFIKKNFFISIFIFIFAVHKN